MNGGLGDIWTLAWTFGLLSLFAIGGAASAIPEMHRIAVDLHHWMTDAQFADAFAISQLSPGPNILIVTLIGYQVAGVAGGFYAHQALFIDANQFDFMRSAVTFLYVILGGASNPFGPIVGAAIVTLLPEMLRVVQDWRMTIFGTLLVVIAIWRPDGLLPSLRSRST